MLQNSPSHVWGRPPVCRFRPPLEARGQPPRRAKVPAPEAVAAADLLVRTDLDRLRLALSPPNPDSCWRFQSDLEIRAPKSPTVRTENRFGATEIADLAGEVETRGQNGAVEVRDVVGGVRAETSYASLIVWNVGPATLRNRNGRISGSAIKGSVKAETSFGRFDVRLPGGLKPLVEARTRFGNIESDFPMMLNPPAADPFASAEPGTPRVSLRNQNGNIRVSRN